MNSFAVTVWPIADCSRLGLTYYTLLHIFYTMSSNTENNGGSERQKNSGKLAGKQMWKFPQVDLS